MPNLPEKTPRKPPLQQFLDECGQDFVIEALQTAEEHSKFGRLATMLHSPKHKRSTVFSLCKKIGISLADFVDFLRNVQQMRGMLRASLHIPEVIEDTAIDAKARLETCKRCDGVGKLPDPSISEDETVRLTRNCPDCDGSGKVRVAGDKDARAIMFETMGLTGKRGPLVAQQFNFGSAGMPESLEKVSGAVVKLIGGGNG